MVDLPGGLMEAAVAGRRALEKIGRLLPNARMPNPSTQMTAVAKPNPVATSTLRAAPAEPSAEESRAYVSGSVGRSPW